MMKRAGIWLIWIVGALSIGYLALYAYAMVTNKSPEPVDPIKIFRKDGSPSYS